MKDTVKYRFGEILRTVREKKHLTLKDVAEKAGFSESLISQIERDKVSPSLDTLLTIAETLGIDPDYLFKDLKRNPSINIVKTNDRKSLVQTGLAFHQLSAIKDTNQQHAVEAYLLEIDPGYQKGSEEYGHVGRELGFILNGQGSFYYGNNEFILEEGDTVSFDSDSPHVLKNNGTGTLKAIWIVTPPKNIFG